MAAPALGTFDVTVDLALRVQVVQALEDLPQDGGDVGFLQGSWLQLWACDRAPAAPTCLPTSGRQPSCGGMQKTRLHLQQ